MKSAQELFNQLNSLDETPWIEAKLSSEAGKSLMETINAYSNEPGLQEGYILIGVSAVQDSLFPQYIVVGVENPDKIQQEIATQSAIMFNLPVRPIISVEKLEGKNVIVVKIKELDNLQKPLYFTKMGLPSGAMRRIGSSDMHCTEDDMVIFYNNFGKSYDKTPVEGTSINDIDESAINRYRNLRAKVLPTAEELTYEDDELLTALGCLENGVLTLAGLLLFGKSSAQRRTFPMLRVDYIRVPGNVWVENPESRFTSIDMRGPLLLNVYKVIEAINTDLPKGFLMDKDQIQAQVTGLPILALREAIVNALMHRSYREHKPTQIIRYDNRIEIINPGFSLKPEDKLGFPGSETRNSFIAAVFHETNLAETKGSGIRAMRRLMIDAKLAPPTFESSREDNEFIARLLLHHFLDEKDLVWLNRFNSFNLNDSQKQALIFVREVGAIDNLTYRQMSDCDALKATTDLRSLRKLNLLTLFGKGKATYYRPGEQLSDRMPSIELKEINTEPNLISTEPNLISTEPKFTSTEVLNLNVVDNEIVEISDEGLSTEAREINRKTLLEELPFRLQGKIYHMRGRETTETIENIIIEICTIRPFKLAELGSILDKGDNYLSRKYLKPLIDKNRLRFLHSDMINHPNQAYLAVV
ncbi:putative DNA binding domain-containing protein [Flavobacterium sp. CYK-55]|uniref:ATP-binding protein n=1 Tax=Flavobacterium sp. CYK-55 TaxID=2835529 RepID=UPI001BD14F2D|nr:ATP-binding protein [Flavobacterium sp. CYK-55]MBS7787022.1 putative DNA binding domain-containing protein [Flavobacterium sp. CYK-55]